jgi:hypothetical protein
MKLIRAAGIQISTPPESDDVHRVLVESAMAFLRGGGCVSLTEWSELTTVEQAALARAGLVLAVEDILSAATASEGPEGYAAVAALADGGQTKRDMLARQAAAYAARQVSGGQ